MAVNTSTNEVTVRKLYDTITGLWTKFTTAAGNKADKVSGATSGNLAGLDANGNLTDSGQAAANLVHDANYVHTDNNYTTTEKNKLSGIASGAQVNVIEVIKRNGTALTITNKTVDISVPTPGTTTPSMNGTGAAGTATTYSRSDHVHPTDTTREATANKKTSINTSSNTEFPTSKAVADFVNSSISTNTANFLGTLDVVTDLGLTTSATNTQIATALGSHTWPTGVTPTNNDYVFISINDSSTTDVDEYRRFKYSETAGTGSWAYEYTLNNSSFTQAQWNAINSGITSTDKSNYDSHLSNTSNPHQVTKEQVGLGNVGNFKAVSTVANQGLTSTEKSNARTNIGAGTYSKPSGGIPQSDLAQAVQDKLDATADISNKLDKTGDGKDVTVTFTAASTRANIATTEKLSVIFGKIAKWYSDFGSLAWKSSVTNSDISGTIADAHIASASTWNSKASGTHTHNVTVNGVAKTIPAPGATAIELMTEMTTQEVTDILDACT